MSLTFNGINQHGSLSSQAMGMGNGAIGMWYQFASKGQENHYLLSTGPLSNGNYNIWYAESGSNVGKISINFLGSTSANRLDMPADFQDGSTPYLILLEKNFSNLYLWHCKTGGTAFRKYIGTSSDLSGSLVWNLMRRADGEPARYASGKVSQLFRINVIDTTTGLTNQVVENMANGVAQPASVIDPQISFRFGEGSGSTATDEIAGATMTLVGGPTWGESTGPGPDPDPDPDPELAPAGTVTIGSISVSDTSANIPFTYSASDASEFKLYLGGVYRSTVLSTPFFITGLTAGQTYNATIVPSNSIGDGSSSAAVNFTTSSVPGAAPKLVFGAGKELVYNTGTLRASETGFIVDINNLSNGAVIARFTEQSTLSNGRLNTIESIQLPGNTTVRVTITAPDGAMCVFTELTQ